MPLRYWPGDKIVCHYCGKTITILNSPNRCAFWGGWQDSEERWHLAVNPIHIHHIDKDHHNNELSNLIRVCWQCHKHLHSKLLREELLNSVT